MIKPTIRLDVDETDHDRRYRGLRGLTQDESVSANRLRRTDDDLSELNVEAVPDASVPATAVTFFAVTNPPRMLTSVTSALLVFAAPAGAAVTLLLLEADRTCAASAPPGTATLSTASL